MKNLEPRGSRDLGIYGPYTKTLTDAQTNLFNVNHDSNSSLSFRVFLFIRADDGTDFQAFAQSVTVASVNKAGAFTSTVQVDGATDSDVEAKAVSAGTLTTAYAISAADPAVFSITPTGSLTETTYEVTWYLMLGVEQPVTIL